jgi:hypothetical protein
MSSVKSKEKQRSRQRALIPALLVLILTLSSSAGCIDKGIVRSIVEKVEGDDEPDYVWKVILTAEGNFVVEPEGDTDIDYMAVATKIGENMTNFDPQNLKKIMNEENISMKKRIVKFPVIANTYNLIIELDGIFKIGIGNDIHSAGYMELTIIQPGGKSYIHEIYQNQETEKHMYPQTPIPGEWTLELQGLGVQSPGDILYSGRYVISIRVEEPKEP